MGQTGGLAHEEAAMHQKKKIEQPYILHYFLRAQKAAALHNLGIFPNSLLFLKFTTCSMKQLMQDHTLLRRGPENVCKYGTGSLLFWFHGLAILKQCSQLSGVSATPTETQHQLERGETNLRVLGECNCCHSMVKEK